ITCDRRSFRIQASGVFISNVQGLGIGDRVNLKLLNDGYLELHIMNPTKLGDYVKLISRYSTGHNETGTPDQVLRVKAAIVEVLPRRGVRSALQKLSRKLSSLF